MTTASPVYSPGFKGDQVKNEEGKVSHGNKCACGRSAGLSGECETCKGRKLLGTSIQRKLAIGEPDDEYEREADRVAEEVIRMREPEDQARTFGAKPASLVQRKGIEAGTMYAQPVPQIVHEVLSSPGQPLDASARAYFEPRFGYDFGHVRIHADTKASKSAKSVHAQAYTVGSHIVLGTTGNPSQGVTDKKLMAHELTHVVQQRQGGEMTPDRSMKQTPSPFLARTPLTGPQNVTALPRNVGLANPDPGTAIQTAIATLTSIRFIEADRYRIETEGMVQELNERQYQQLSELVRTELRKGINVLWNRTNSVKQVYDRTVKLNSAYWPVTAFMEVVFGTQDPGAKLATAFENTERSLKGAEGALSGREFPLVLKRLEHGEHEIMQAEQMVDDYRKSLDASAETIAKGAVLTRNVSVGVLIGIGAVLATPVVAGGISAGVTGAGVTGFTGTTLTTLGTGTVVTGGGALTGASIEGTINVVEQALKGEGFDEGEFIGKLGEGAKLGSTSALGGAATAGMGGILGQGTTITGQAVRGGISGYAGGASSSGFGAVLEGKSLKEIAKAYQLGGFEGMIGGAFGGTTSVLTQGRSLVTRLGLETLGGGISSGLGAAATGKSTEEIVQSIIIGSITGGAVELGTPKTETPKTKPGPRVIEETQRTNIQEETGRKLPTEEAKAKTQGRGLQEIDTDEVTQKTLQDEAEDFSEAVTEEIPRPRRENITSKGTALESQGSSAELHELARGKKLGTPPTPERLLEAQQALKAGTAGVPSYITLLAQIVSDARQFAIASTLSSRNADTITGEVLPVSSRRPRPHFYWDFMNLCCGPGRDISTASLAHLAKESAMPIRIERYQATEVFGFGGHAFSVVEFPDGTKFLVDATFHQFVRIPTLPGKKATTIYEFLSRDPELLEFGKALLQDGYIPLNPKTAKMYIESMAAQSEQPMVPSGGLEELIQTFLSGSKAMKTETVGQGQEGISLFEPESSKIELPPEEILVEAKSARETLMTVGGHDDQVAFLDSLILKIESLMNEP